MAILKSEKFVAWAMEWFLWLGLGPGLGKFALSLGLLLRYL